MFTLTLWLIIAFIGLMMYVSPAFYTRRMYEGFTSETSLTGLPAITPPGVKLEDVLQANGVAPATPVEPSPNSTAGPSPDIDTLMRNIQDIMRVQTHTPDLGNHPVTELVESEPIKAVGAKELPKDASSTKSQPATSHEDASKSSALEQGKSFEETIPKSNANPVVVERVIEKVVRVPRKCPKQECPKQECPKQKCPKQECPSPVCPDMRDYIRKDSIPCWACKLN